MGGGGKLYQKGGIGESYINRETIVSNSCGGTSLSADAFRHGQDLKQIIKVNLKLLSMSSNAISLI